MLKAWSRRDKMLPQDECCSDRVTLFCMTAAGFIRGTQWPLTILPFLGSL